MHSGAASPQGTRVAPAIANIGRLAPCASGDGAREAEDPLAGLQRSRQRGRAGATPNKTMSHPTLGVLHFEHTSFQANDDPALKLVIYTRV
ncbi:hypothetical protein B5V03_05425 [Bradyrhizobium betae]|uniref:MmyB-like transcription regulator ligand binding domain-containing protein n=1 Tax=Bradyrhizobium betae TaxID=244734 RepID=A0A4Q1VGL6_9BRAD|nr:hypothetical protein B5V03_05425 [Bradyrhizobium betae]